MILVTVTAFMTFALLALSSPVTGDGLKSERDLRRDIFQDYDKLVRPVKKASTPVTVGISVTPLSIRSMNEKEQLISLETWIFLTWKDEYLSWDPSEYDNITDLRVAPSEIWKPDIALYTASPDTSLFPAVYTQAIVYNSGTVLWVPPFTMNSRCPIPFRNYVSGSRAFIECNIRLGSWTFSEKLMDIQLTTEKVDLTNFQDYNHEWKLVKILANRESKYYPCCVEAYPLVNFNVTLKRRNYYLNPNDN